MNYKYHTKALELKLQQHITRGAVKQTEKHYYYIVALVLVASYPWTSRLKYSSTVPGSKGVESSALTWSARISSGARF